jgi:hypothetical protein
MMMRPALDGHHLGLARVEHVELGHRWRRDDVDPAAPELGGARARVPDGAKDEALGCHRAAPVRGIRLEHELLIPLPLDEAIGAGAHRVLRERLRAGLLARLLRQDLQPRQVEEHGGHRLRRDHIHGTGVLHLGPRDAAGEDGAAVLLVHVLLHGVLDVVRVEGLAVVELDALPEMEAPGRRVHGFPPLSQQADHLEILALDADERIEEVLLVDLGREQHAGRRVQALPLLPNGHDPLRLGRRRLCAAVATQRTRLTITPPISASRSHRIALSFGMWVMVWTMWSRSAA